MKRPQLARVPLRHLDRDSGGADVRSRRFHRLQVAVGSEDRRRRDLASGQLLPQPREDRRLGARRAANDAASMARVPEPQRGSHTGVFPSHPE